MTLSIDQLKAPAMITWQLTRDCNLACLHCCTDSAPGRALPGELSEREAMAFADQIIAAGVPKVMICGGEPPIVPHFSRLVRKLGSAGVLIKIETNGQQFGRGEIEQIKDLPIFSIQISLDGDTQEVYSKQRPGGILEKAHAACRLVREAGMPLEVTFAPTRVNIHEAEAVVERAAAFGAFRFNTGKLMRLGTAAKLWNRLEPAPEQYDAFAGMLRKKRDELNDRMEMLFEPWDISGEIRAQLEHPPATVLMLPDGKFKVSAALPYYCADIRRDTLAVAWEKYCNAWRTARIRQAVLDAAVNPQKLLDANQWVELQLDAPSRTVRHNETPVPHGMAPVEAVHGLS